MNDLPLYLLWRICDGNMYFSFFFLLCTICSTLLKQRNKAKDNRHIPIINRRINYYETRWLLITWPLWYFIFLNPATLGGLRFIYWESILYIDLTFIWLIASIDEFIILPNLADLYKNQQIFLAACFFIEIIFAKNFSRGM